MLVVPGLWLAAWLARRRPLARTPLNGALVLLCLALLASLAATYSLEVSLPKLAGMVLALGIFFAAARIDTQRAWAAGLVALVAGGMLLAGISLIGVDWRDKFAPLARLTARLPGWLRGLPGAEGGFDPNQVAGTLLWVLPLILALAAHAWRHPGWLARQFGPTPARAWRWLLALAALLCAVTLLLTQSRAALLSFAAILALAGLCLAYRLHDRRAWLLAGLALASVALWAITIGRPVLQREAVRAGIIGGDDASVLATGAGRGRAEVWARSLDAVQLFPFTGMGMNTFRTVMPALFPFWNAPTTYDISHAHNEFLQAALDLGLPGLIALCALYLIAARLLWQIAAGPVSTPLWPASLRRWLSLGIAASLLAHLLFGLVDAVALGAKTGVFFWLVLGLTASLYYQVHEGAEA